MLAVTLQAIKRKNNARSNAANDETQKTMLAVTLQAIKRKKQRSQ